MTRGSERARRLPRAMLAVALAPLAVSAGCASMGDLLTTELWRGYAWPAPTVDDQLVERRVTQVDGALAVVRPVIDNGLWWCDGADLVPSTRLMCPPPGSDSSAAVAGALFANPDVFVVRSAAIDAVRRNVCGEVVAEEATLELDVQLRGSALGEAVAEADVSPAAAAVLDAVRPRSYELAVDADRRLPSVYERCAERLQSVDLRELAGERDEVVVEAWAFVDCDGQPVFRVRPDDPDAETSDDVGPRPPLGARLAALREVSLLVRVHGESGSTIVRVRPDLLWLASMLQHDGDRCVHRSTWALRTAEHPLAGTASIQAPRVASTLRLQEDRYQRTYYPVLVDGKLLANVALTPVTVALDLVVGPGIGDLLRAITGTRRERHELPQHDPN